jgi:hypothetical protein
MDALKFFSSKTFRWIERLVVLIFLGAVYLNGVESVPFQPDESHTIHTSVYFETFFHGDFSSQLWSENYWTLTQPPLSRYWVGLGRRLGGYTSENLIGPWDWYQDEAYNLAAGNMPSVDLLWWSRLPMVVLAIFSGWFIFLLVREIGGVIGGYTWVGLYASSTYFLVQLRRALSEASLLAFTALAALLVWQALESRRKASLKGGVGAGTAKIGWQGYFVWLVCAGAACGLAGATKLNGMASVAGIFALASAAAWFGRRIFPERRWFETAVRGAILPVLSALLVFVAVNPYLYTDPLTRIGRMIKWRGQEMEVQVARFPHQLIPENGHLVVICERIFKTYAVLQFPAAMWVNLALALAGAVVIGKYLVAWIRGEGGSAAMASLAFLTIFAPAALLVFVTPLDWERYYLMGILFATGLIAIAVGVLAEFLLRTMPALLSKL